MYDEEIKTNEVYEVEPIQEEETKSEVTPDVIYVPAPADAETDKGPNKTLIALGIGAGLLIAKPAIRKAKELAAKRKQKKEDAEAALIRRVLEAEGLVQPKVEEKPAETATQTAETKVETPANNKADTEQK